MSYAFYLSIRIPSCWCGLHWFFGEQTPKAWGTQVVFSKFTKMVDETYLIQFQRTCKRFNSFLICSNSEKVFCGAIYLITGFARTSFIHNTGLLPTGFLTMFEHVVP